MGKLQEIKKKHTLLIISILAMCFIIHNNNIFFTNNRIVLYHILIIATYIYFTTNMSNPLYLSHLVVKARSCYHEEGIITL